MRRIRKTLARILELPDGEGLLTTAGMFPLTQFREFAGGSEPQEGLMGLIRGHKALDNAVDRHTAIYKSDYTLIGQRDSGVIAGERFGNSRHCFCGTAWKQKTARQCNPHM